MHLLILSKAGHNHIGRVHCEIKFLLSREFVIEKSAKVRFEFLI